MTDQYGDGHHDASARELQRVRDRYAAAALQVLAGTRATCRDDECGADCGPSAVIKDADVDAVFGAGLYAAEERAELPVAAVAASLGCGNPTAIADLNEGEIVLDLGSGGGIDVLLSAGRVGSTGRAYGLDMTDEMLELARANAAKAGAANVEFRKGTIENIPLDDGTIDVVISNCVVNLSPDKPAVFAETYRVLRPGGRIGITDVVAGDHLSMADRSALGGRTECIAGALSASEYRAGLIAAGFVHVEITRTHEVREGMDSAIIRAAKPYAPSGVSIRPMRAADADQVLAVYQAGLDTGNAGFETTAPAWDAYDQAKLSVHRYVATDSTSGKVLGWVAASRVSERCVYAGVVEHSIYVSPDASGRGIGAALLRAFLDSTEAAGIWTVQTGVFPENAASLALHRRAGFRTVGTRERIGQHHGRWRDVIFIERRSPAVPGSAVTARRP
jgi:L-amino acid N-acyltransferase YncA/2-polyprenyl-3-methyl-5-hydroxy-6-metoxy-1,4-benzoquinol methylase